MAGASGAAIRCATQTRAARSMAHRTVSGAAQSIGDSQSASSLLNLYNHLHGSACGPLDALGMLVAVAAGTGLLRLGMSDGRFAAVAFVFGGVALLAAALDLRMITRGGVVGAQRLARHLWRMC